MSFFVGDGRTTVSETITISVTQTLVAGSAGLVEAIGSADHAFGTMTVYVADDDSMSADQAARIRDAIAELNRAYGDEGLRLTEVDDAAGADIIDRKSVV